MLTVHWDGKLMCDLTGNDKVDRLPILVSTMGDQKLLDIPKLATGTGQVMAQAVYIKEQRNRGTEERHQKIAAGKLGSGVFRYNWLKYRMIFRSVRSSRWAIRATPLTLRLPASYT